MVVDDSNSWTTTELDTHADTCCFGRNCLVISEDTSMSVTISGFADSLGDMECPIVSVAVAYDVKASHTTFILVFNQVFYDKELCHNLISPFQMRMNDIIVKDVPLQVNIQ